MRKLVWKCSLQLMVGAQVVGCLAGCVGDRGSKEVFDLVDAFPAATVSTETEVVKFIDPAVKKLLGPGWVLPREGLEIKGKAWGIGRQSEMNFFRLLPEALTLTFRCLPFAFDDGRYQRVSFLVNGQLVNEAELPPGGQQVEVNVPAEVLRSGENSLIMKYAESQSRDVAYFKRGQDRAVAWNRLTIRPSVVRSDDPPSVDVSKRSLFIPFGSRVDYFLGPVGSGEFSARSIEIAAGDRGRLIVSSQVGEEGETVVGQFTEGRWRTTATVAGDEINHVRVSLAAVGRPAPGCADRCGITVGAPEVRTIRGEIGNTIVGMSLVDEEKAPSGQPNVVVYLIDALRADHLGCYGYDRPVSPNIDRFADRSILFEKAQAQTSWTRASVASVFTGLMPQVHSANDDDDALSDSVTTIAEYLQAEGYQTGAFSANGNAGPNVGFAQGFDTFENLGPTRSEELNSEAFSWLDTLQRDRPFFLWVHAVDPHAPYDPPDDLRREFAAKVTEKDLGSVARVESLTQHPDRLSLALIDDMVSLYDAEIAANDRSFGALISDLKKRGIYDETLIILVSDHGEEFYDHGGWTHGKTLYAEQLDIPLVVKLPGEQGSQRISQVVQHVDILPTVLGVVGLDLSAEIQGVDLRALLTEQGKLQWENHSFSSLDLRGRKGTSVYDGRWKMIRLHDRGRGHHPELFDKDSDRLERTDSSSTSPALMATMLAFDKKLTHRLPEPISAPTVDTSAKEEMREALKALGYIE